VSDYGEELAKLNVKMDVACTAIDKLTESVTTLIQTTTRFEEVRNDVAELKECIKHKIDIKHVKIFAAGAFLTGGGSVLAALKIIGTF